MKLLDAVKMWMDEDVELRHFYLENSTREDFDADWIICNCSDLILATVKERSVLVMTAPIDTSLDKVRVRLPRFYELPMEHPQFFEMIKYSLLTYHKCYLERNT